MNGEDCVVQIDNHTSTFRSTSVKPYLMDDESLERPVLPSESSLKTENLSLDKIPETVELRRSLRNRKLIDFENFFHVDW